MSVAYYNGQQINNFADATKINYKAYYNNYILFGADADTGETPTDYSEQYLTFVAKSNGTFVFSGSQSSNVISYSTDDGLTWSTPAQVATINVNIGDNVLWKGEMTPERWGTRGVGRYSGGTASFDVKGNIMSLLYGDNFENQTSLKDKYCAFYSLFHNTNCVDASNVILQATTLAQYCYRSMFYGCTSLTTAPSLPATILEDGCYANMFQGCSSLTTAPQLTATSVVSSCYSNMFSYCTSLTTAPELLATTLDYACYSYMFFGCTNLNYIKMLATNISADYCLNDWVYGVANSGTFVKAASATLPSGNSGIPNGWTVQNATE